MLAAEEKKERGWRNGGNVCLGLDSLLLVLLSLALPVSDQNVPASVNFA